MDVGEIAIGRWSELRRVRGDHLVSRAMEWLTMVRSGDDGLPFVGKRVGRLSFRSTIVLESMASMMVLPRAAVLLSCVVENQARL